MRTFSPAHNATHNMILILREPETIQYEIVRRILICIGFVLGVGKDVSWEWMAEEGRSWGSDGYEVQNDELMEN